MMRGIYASASSLLTLLKRQASYSHNLANVNTPGFKQEIPWAETGELRPLSSDSGGYDGSLVGDLTFGTNGELTTDYSQGPMQNTGEALDLAIVGKGFFRIQTPAGVRLTRDGTFLRDSAGYLVNAQGNYLLGDNGRIQIPEGTPSISEDGSIFVNGTARVARISLANVADPNALAVQPNNLLDPGTAQVQAVAAGQTQIRQGYLEQANVDVSGAMVGMMSALRSYQATQKSLQMQDQALQKVMEIGRTA